MKNDKSINKRSDYIVILDIVGLEVSHLTESKIRQCIPNILSLAENGEYGYMKPVFPSVTCTVQSSILTGKFPNEHGIISNGMYDRENLQVSFWEQSTNLVQCKKIWDILKDKKEDLKTALLFFQNSMYSNSDYVITPRPLHLETGKMEMWCYSRPVNYYEDVTSEIGEFNLLDYWGPFVNIKSSDWISKSVEFTIKNKKPHILFAYFPQLDYTAQKYGKYDDHILEDLKLLDTLVGNIINKTKEVGIYDRTQFIILSEYSFNEVNNAIPINRILREQGLLKVRTIKGKEYVDYEFSDAFAMVDHQIAHIYLKNQITTDLDNKRYDKLDIKQIIEKIPGVEYVLDEEEKKNLKINHYRSGELIAVADRDKWFSYYWWFEQDKDLDKIDTIKSSPSSSSSSSSSDTRNHESISSSHEQNNDKAPSFTKTVDIHRKPGYDPMELFIDPIKRCISTNTRLIKGSHGRPANLDTGEGLSVYISSKKIPNIIKDTYNGNNLIECIQIFDIINKNFE